MTGRGGAFARSCRERVTECRGLLSDAMRALSVPSPDRDAAVSALRACADLCDRLVVAMVDDRLGGGTLGAPARPETGDGAANDLPAGAPAAGADAGEKPQAADGDRRP